MKEKAKIQPSRSGLYPVGTPPGVETPGYYRMSLPGQGRKHGDATGVRRARGRNPGRRALEKPLKRLSPCHVGPPPGQSHGANETGVANLAGAGGHRRQRTEDRRQGAPPLPGPLLHSEWRRGGCFFGRFTQGGTAFALGYRYDSPTGLRPVGNWRSTGTASGVRRARGRSPGVSRALDPRLLSGNPPGWQKAGVGKILI